MTLLMKRLGFFELPEEASLITLHAKCTAGFGDQSTWLSEWQQTAHMITSRAEALHTQAKEGKSHTLLQRMAYKLFASLVQYEDSYRGMQRVVLDGKNLEATANVVCQRLDDGQNFVCAPYWVDSIGHLGGFVTNANDELDSKTQVYVSHGWESMRFSRPLEPGKQYQTYVRMLPAEGKMVAGDVYMLEGGSIIGLVGGLKFQCIPRSVLDHLSPPSRSYNEMCCQSPTRSGPKRLSRRHQPLLLRELNIRSHLENLFPLPLRYWLLSPRSVESS
jgi:iterative type I PKS product template protein